MRFENSFRLSAADADLVYHKLKKNAVASMAVVLGGRAARRDTDRSSSLFAKSGDTAVGGIRCRAT